ncbi:MAG: DMT family transporter [Magnetococcus sp. YQC-9]
MPIWLVFLTLTFIWGSTPMAVQWSQDGVGFSLAVTARIGIGVVLFMLLIPWLKRREAPWRQLIIVSTIAGLNLFGSMLCIYWSARFLPSGWISVLFGLGPILTGVIAASWLKEPFTRQQWFGSLLGFLGLLIIFVQGGAVGEQTLIGIAVILLSVLIYAAGNVGIKRWNHGISPLWVTAGSLWVAFPLFLVAFLLSGESWPEHFSVRAGSAILYLGFVGNGLGFVCFYYLLSRISAANAALVTLSAPAIALWLGVAFNHESVQGGLVAGTLLILSGLALYQWGWPKIALSWAKTG